MTDPSHAPRSTFGSWSDIGSSSDRPQLFPLHPAAQDATTAGSAQDATAAAGSAEVQDDESDCDEHEDEQEAEVVAFSQPSGPWSTLEDMVDSWETAANCCNHRFKLCYATSSHVCVKYSKSVEGSDVTSRIPDFGYFYCSCTKAGACQVKPHAKSWCPFKV